MPAVSAARAARRNASAKKKLAQDRRNAMSQMSHRKSLVRGIISVASGEVRQKPLDQSFFGSDNFASNQGKSFMSPEHHRLWSVCYGP